jgi:hypothetical protein
VEVEKRLWDAHSLINQRYRKLLKHFRNGEKKNYVVEKRKLEKRYVDFIKTSQFFYKGYIQRLASHFAGMQGLRRIAHRLSLSLLSVDERVKVAPNIEDLIEKSCHATLLRLGDLSRYRNDLRTKDRSWEPALGYYTLASDLDPDSGSSHNQMAVIALSDENHLDALYHLYRAIVVEKPHPAAKGNLEIEFKKITAAFEKNSQPSPKDDIAKMVLWFVRLHAKLYKGVEFPGHQELENEFLHRLALLLKEQSFEQILEKFVLINFAAGYFAGEKIRGQLHCCLVQPATNRVTEKKSDLNPEDIQSFYFFLQLNVRFLFVLLQILQPELEDTATGEDLPSTLDRSQSNNSREKITAITRRVLPALRQYSAWLMSHADLIIATVGNGPINIHIKEMWKMYADVLTRLANYFPIPDLSAVSYLLEEDQTTVGFKPLRDPDLPLDGDFYTDGNGLLKLRITDPGVERHHPNVEMLSRVRDILVYGLLLQGKDESPILLDSTGVFVFVEEGLPITSPVRGVQAKNPPPTDSMHSSSNLGMTQSDNLQHDEVVPDESVAASDSHNSMDIYLHHMVDSLVETSSGRSALGKESSYDMHSRTGNEIFAPLGQNSTQPLQQSTPKMLPSLPGIWSSPFTPQPNELQPTSPDRLTTARQQSPLQFATSQQQLAAAAALDEMTGYGKSKYNSWGRSSRPSSNSASQPVNQILQESLSQQFMPLSMQSTSFSESSSLYANTPHAENRYSDGASRTGLFSGSKGNNTTHYAGESDFDRTTMLQSSIWNGSQPGWGAYVQTPPGGQGG